MKKKYGIAIILLMGILLLSGCAPSEDKQAKEVLAEYFKIREHKLYIDDYQQNGVIETKSIENKELILVSDAASKNKLYVFEPTKNKKTNPVFLVDIANKEIFQKFVSTLQGGVPIYVKVSPLLEEDIVDAAFAKIETETTPELKETVTQQLESAKTELYDQPATQGSSSGTAPSTGGATQSASNQSGSTSQSGSNTASGSNTSSGSGSSSGTPTDPGSGGTTDPGTSDQPLPTATVEFYKSLSPGMKIALVKLATDQPENYKVTYADVTLTYNGEFSAYIGDVPTATAENLQPTTTRR